MHAEHRRAARKKARQAASITFGESGTKIPCVLWDVSHCGARLTAAHGGMLPEMFTLHMTDGTAPRLCRVIWRRKPHVGVQFIPHEDAQKMQRWIAMRRPEHGVYLPREK